MGAHVAVVFLILGEARLQNIDGGEMVPQVIMSKVVGRPVRLALLSIFLYLLPLAASRFHIPHLLPIRPEISCPSCQVCRCLQARFDPRKPFDKIAMTG